MENAVSKRRSSRISSIENVKPNLKRKATSPLRIYDFSERPVLKNLTNQPKKIKNRSKEEDVQKKVPNYLKPTFSTQQKCHKKKTDLSEEKPIGEKVSQASLVPRAVAGQKLITKPTVHSAPEEYFGFEDELDTKKLDKTSDKRTEKQEDQKTENQKKPVEIDIASPLRIEITPFRRIIASTPKPPVNHVLSVLKSSLSSPLARTPRSVETKLSQFFKSAPLQRVNKSLDDSVQFVDEPNISFENPPRRSYTRQRPVTNFSEFDEPSSDEEEKEEKVEEKEEPKAKQIKPTKTKKVTQDKQFEELAAAMNSQFNQVENFQLVVE